MKSFLTLACLLFFWPALAQSPLPQADYRFIEGSSVVQTKNFYLLTLLAARPEVASLLSGDTALQALYQAKINHLQQSLEKCGAEAGCYSLPMKFSEDEISRVSARLAALYTDSNPLGRLVQEHLIPSGTYLRYASGSRKDLLLKAWEQDARGLNHVLAVYAEGMHPNYPAIDSIAFIPQSRVFGTLTHDVADLVQQEAAGELFFTPTLTYALRFLEVNDRYEAADFEPMQQTVNRAASQRARSVDWAAYKYTLILIPGAGPSTPGVALSPGGMLRCRLGALRYREGLAPFIVVSGGRVHPYKTRFSEAYEMKKYLMEVLNIPEEAILMDPHARHTTTNLRNTVRLLFRYGMPVDKPCLVTTAKSQSFYITNDNFVERCQKELGYVPHRLGQRLSETDVEFYPVLDALHIDQDEPLDP